MNGQASNKQNNYEVEEPRIIDSSVTAAINVEDLFEQQKDRFDFYDAAAAVNAAQKLKQKLLNEQNTLNMPVAHYEESGGSSSAEEMALRRSLPEEPQMMSSEYILQH